MAISPFSVGTASVSPAPFTPALASPEPAPSPDQSVLPSPSPDPAPSPASSSLSEEAYRGKFVKTRLHDHHVVPYQFDRDRVHVIVSKSTKEAVDKKDVMPDLQVSDLVLTLHPQDRNERFFLAEIQPMTPTQLRVNPNLIKVAWKAIDRQEEIGYIPKHDPKKPAMERILPYTPDLVTDRVSSIFALQSGLRLKGYSE